MKSLYEINKDILTLVDEETGEISDFAKLEELNLERDAKLESLALWVKNLEAEAEMIKAERTALADREKSALKKADSLKNYLSEALCGQSFKTPKAAITFRKTTSVEVDNSFIEWAKANADDLLRYKDPEPDKAAIKEAITTGLMIQGARILTNLSMSIK